MSESSTDTGFAVADVKTKGFRDPEGGKGYELKLGGITLICVKEGSRWNAEGRCFYTIKDIKQYLVDFVNARMNDPIAKQYAEPPEPHEQLIPDESEPGKPDSWQEPRINLEAPVVPDAGTWSCIHPCALLILHQIPLSQEVMRTLDAYGYLLSDGQPDSDQALREYRLKYEQPLLEQQQVEQEVPVEVPIWEISDSNY